MGKEIYILSDIHLGVCSSTDWYKKEEHDNELMDMLNMIAERGKHTNVDLVLAGDVFDTWLCPMDQTPPTIEEILAKNVNVIATLKETLTTLDGLYYINGNHDMHVTDKDLADIRIGDKKIQCIKEYRSGLMKVEHGHRYAMFNARDKLHDPLHGLPLGYFITRLLAGDESYDSPCAVASYIDDLLEAAVTTQTIAESVIEAIMEHRNLTPNDVFFMPFNRRPITIEEVKTKYRSLFDRWVEKKGYMYAINSIRAELGSLEWFADRLAKKHDYKVVVMGHTHDSHLEEDRIVFHDNRIYANSGYWATDKPTYVKVLKDQGKYTVSLHSRKNREDRLIKQESV